ncbi:MAG: hypothetical protein FJW35_11620 [Acidobacteria bacterium]|nr:hypothetical protein [Acidobacteriota bacterium]
MKAFGLRSVVLWLVFQAGCVAPGAAQSLAEAARKEAERRKALQLQGITAKVITSQDLRLEESAGRLTVSEGTPHRSAPDARPPAATPENLRRFQTELLRLDREIRESEEQLDLTRDRAERERWAPPAPGRVGRSRGSGPSYEQLRSKALELEKKLRRLRDERLEVYRRGRRAGFHPGELEGRGILP